MSKYQVITSPCFFDDNHISGGFISRPLPWADAVALASWSWYETAIVAEGDNECLWWQAEHRGELA